MDESGEKWSKRKNERRNGSSIINSLALPGKNKGVLTQQRHLQTPSRHLSTYTLSKCEIHISAYTVIVLNMKNNIFSVRVRSWQASLRLKHQLCLWRIMWALSMPHSIFSQPSPSWAQYGIQRKCNKLCVVQMATSQPAFENCA